MPAPLTYTAIALMARDRVRQVRDFLAARDAAGGANEIEKQVLYLARRAYDLMSGIESGGRRVGEPAIDPPILLYGPPVGTDKVAKFLLMGAVGPEIPAYASRSKPGQRWLRDTIHKGSPDEDREHVLVGSTEFIFEFWRLVQPKVRAAIADATRRDAAIRNMQSFALGHLCHVAADVVSSPFVDDVSGHLGVGSRSKLSREQVVDAIDIEIAKTYFRKGDPRAGHWADWWPATSDVPNALYEAYKEALELEKMFGAGALRPGFGEYNAQRARDNPPALTIDFLKQGYSTFRNLFATVRVWGWGAWFGLTAPLYVPAIVALPIAKILPEGKLRFREPEPSDIDKDIADYEITVFPFAATAIMPLVVTLVTTLVGLGDTASVVMGWVSAVVQAAAAIGFFASLGEVENEDLWATWLFLFAIPVVVELVHIVLSSIWADGDAVRQFLSLSSALHIVLSLGLALLYRAYFYKGIHGLDDDYPNADKGDFWERFGVWSGIVVVVWVVTAIIMRLVFSPSRNTGINEFVTRQRHHLRLFDDTTLFNTPPRAGGDPPPVTLADMHYPSGRRPLLKLWWTGNDPDKAKVRSMRDRLEFDFNGTKRTVYAPLAPTKLSEFAAYLKRTVKDGANQAKLEANAVYPGDLDFDYELPAGLVFSDEGDDQKKQSDHDSKASEYKKLGDSETKAYVLYHAPKGHLATRFGTGGVAAGSHKHAADTNAPDAADRVRTAAANALQIQRTAGTTDFRTFFRPGDRIFSGAQRRIIVSVDSATQVTVSTAFNPALAAGGVAFGRGQIDRTSDEAANNAWRARSPLSSENMGPNDVVGTAGALFGQIFKPGDTIRVIPTSGDKKPQTHKIQTIVSDTQMTLETPLVPAIVAGDAARLERLADEKAEGFEYFSDPDDMIFAGQSVMNHAADLAVLLCLGGTSRLLSDGDRQPGQVGTANGLNKVFQVFRNWNLDRRRINEWKMLVAGGAVSEKRGNLAAADPAAPTEPGWNPGPATGETVSNELGWVNVLRSWLDMARRPRTNTRAQNSFKPGDRQNLELSQALAYLFDMRDPA